MIYWKHTTNNVRYKIPTIEKGIMIIEGKKREVYTNQEEGNYVIKTDGHLFFVLGEKQYNAMGTKLNYE
ncbi:hypothetical protein [Sphingobacterium humi]|uniref:Uncharacterized protein n=1 Tax=Sphingobacterium humi TaxID=1796905 RepID=A0A6N8L0X9_9SPHI|nr:hypothetical protein [Sphingobacterium humi]MVZ62151.1 hypothetical protein [Sphingobacterium humi]